MKRWYLVPTFAALAAFLVGCGASGPKMVEVSGTVKYDGKEVADGDITFVPADTAVGPEGGKIVAGKYAMKVKEGKNAVKITSTRTVPGKKGSMGEDFVEQYISEKYNEKTELSADVSGGSKEHNFDLKK